MNKGEFCIHIDEITNIKPLSNKCESCYDIGNSWVQLRLCQICGYVGCSDKSKNKHARKHYEESGHPIVQSFKNNEDWYWCYSCKALFTMRNREFTYYEKSDEFV